MQIADARHDLVLLAAQRALLGITDQALVVVDRDAHADAGGLIDLVGLARLEGQVAEDLLQEARHFDLAAALMGRRRFLLHDGDLVVDVLRIMGADLHVEAVLERRDDPAAAGVVLRVGAGDDDDVERQANLVAFDLDVFFFHQIEQPDLHFFRQVGQLVDGEDAAIGARHETVVDGFLVGEIAALGDLDRIDFADQIGDRDVRRRQLLAVAAVAIDPLERQRVAQSSAASCDKRGKSAGKDCR